MAKAQPKRKRAAVRSAKRTRTNNWWYGLTALVVIVGIALIVYARETAPAPVGPFVGSRTQTKDTHWHAAMGVYDCDHWLSDGAGDGVWQWPIATPEQAPGRAGNTRLYAGLHSHADGIIHMEPRVAEEAGRHATIGKYFDFGGWDVSDTSFNFLGVEKKNGDTCGDKPGKLVWKVARWNPSSDKQAYRVETGNPGTFKLNNDDIVVIAFLPDDKKIEDLPDPPSLPNLANASSTETPPGQMPTVPGTTAPGSPTAPGSTTGASTPPPTDAP
jgi:hypothetical protein